MGKRIRVYEMLSGNWTHDGEEGAEMFEGDGAKSKAYMAASKVAGKDDFITVDYSIEEKRRMRELGLDVKRMVPKQPKRGEW